MKEISLSELKKMTTKEIKNEGCFRVTSDGEFAFLIMAPFSAEKKSQLEALGSQINAALGK